MRSTVAAVAAQAATTDANATDANATDTNATDTNASSSAPTAANGVDWTAELHRATLALQDPFVVSGSLSLPFVKSGLPAVQPSKVGYCERATGPCGHITLKGAFGEVTLPESLNKSAPAINRLIEHCTHAPFGHGNRTIYDPNVRQAFTMPASDFTVEGLDQEAWHDMIEDIRMQLVPDACELDVRLDKLNLYLTGGHFASHRDTPRDAAHIGTLVVCLPLPFVGGTFTIQHGTKEAKLMWGYDVFAGKSTSPYFSIEKPYADFFPRPYFIYDSSMSPTSDISEATKAIHEMAEHVPSSYINYAAFFGHCEHSIKKVLFGARLTLSYQLLRRDVVQIPRGLSTLDRGVALRANTLIKTLYRAICDPAFYPDGGTLGFACSHLYEDQELPPSKEHLTSTSEALQHAIKLKGADFLIAFAAVSLGLDVSAVRLLSESCSNERFAVARFPDGRHPKLWAQKMFVRESWDYHGGSFEWCAELDTFTDVLGAGDEEAIEDANWIVALPLVDSSRRGVNPPPVGRLGDVLFSGTGYFGNEANMSTIYTHTALIVDVPGYSDRIHKIGGEARASATSDLPDDLVAAFVDALTCKYNRGEKRPLDDATETSINIDADDGPRQLIRTRIQSATIAKLKELLRAKRLPVSGRRDVLVHRALEHIGEISEKELDEMGIFARQRNLAFDSSFLVTPVSPNDDEPKIADHKYRTETMATECSKWNKKTFTAQPKAPSATTETATVTSATSSTATSTTPPTTTAADV